MLTPQPWAKCQGGLSLQPFLKSIVWLGKGWNFRPPTLRSSNHYTTKIIWQSPRHFQLKIFKVFTIAKLGKKAQAPDGHDFLLINMAWKTSPSGSKFVNKTALRLQYFCKFIKTYMTFKGHDQPKTKISSRQTVRQSCIILQSKCSL